MRTALKRKNKTCLEHKSDRFYKFSSINIIHRATKYNVILENRITISPGDPINLILDMFKGMQACVQTSSAEPVKVLSLKPETLFDIY